MDRAWLVATVNACTTTSLGQPSKCLIVLHVAHNLDHDPANLDVFNTFFPEQLPVSADDSRSSRHESMLATASGRLACAETEQDAGLLLRVVAATSHGALFKLQQHKLSTIQLSVAPTCNLCQSPRAYLGRVQRLMPSWPRRASSAPNRRLQCCLGSLLYHDPDPWPNRRARYLPVCAREETKKPLFLESRFDRWLFPAKVVSSSKPCPGLSSHMHRTSGQASQFPAHT